MARYADTGLLVAYAGDELPLEEIFPEFFEEERILSGGDKCRCNFVHLEDFSIEQGVAYESDLERSERLLAENSEDFFVIPQCRELTSEELVELFRTCKPAVVVNSLIEAKKHDSEAMLIVFHEPGGAAVCL